MLQVQVISPSEATDHVVTWLGDEQTVTNLVVVPHAARRPEGDLLQFSLPRSNASYVIEKLRAEGMDRLGAIIVHETGTEFGEGSLAAEDAAPGNAEDSVIWDAVEAKARAGCKMSWAFFGFAVLGTMIAAIGRYLDQPVLVVGAMALGPEFVPIATLSFGLARRRWGLILPALRILTIGFAVAIGLTLLFWTALHALVGLDVTYDQRGHLTDFIVKPDIWSLAVSILAGIAGTLGLTASKESPMIGVFISITTVPAAGAFALAVPLQQWDAAWAAIVQLGFNLLGVILAGLVTLSLQQLAWDRTRRRHGQTVEPSVVSSDEWSP